MHNDILDETEQYTGPRTCPECGYQFPLGKFVRRYVMSYGLSKWNCQNCGQAIQCDFIKLQFFWLLGLIPFGFLFGASLSYFDLDNSFSFFFLLPFFAFVLLTFYYVKFEKQD